MSDIYYLEIIGSSFSSSITKGGGISSNGGALSLRNLGYTQYPSSFVISSTEFFSNEAEGSGGAIYWDTQKPVMRGETFLSNSAIVYGPNIAGPSHKLV